MTQNARFVDLRMVGLRLPGLRTKKVGDAGAKDPSLLQSKAAKDSAKRSKIGLSMAAALAVRKMSARRGISGQALRGISGQAIRGVQTVRVAGGVSGVALDGEMVTNETGIAVTAVPHQVHAGVAHVADSGIVAPAGHQTARTAAVGATANQQGAQTVGDEAAAGDPAADGATVGGARPVVVGAGAGARDVRTRGAERSASRLAVWARDVTEAAAGATLATGNTGAPEAPATDIPVDERARAMVRATVLGVSTLSWTSAARATCAMTATLISPR